MTITAETANDYLVVAVPTAVLLAGIGVVGWWVRNRKTKNGDPDVTANERMERLLDRHEKGDPDA